LLVGYSTLTRDGIGRITNEAFYYSGIDLTKPVHISSGYTYSGSTAVGDPSFRRTLTYSSGANVLSVPDSVGRLKDRFFTPVGGGQSLLGRYRYAGQVTLHREQFYAGTSNKMVTDLSFDGYHRLTSLDHKLNGGASTHLEQYVWDAGSNLLNARVTLTTGGGSGSKKGGPSVPWAFPRRSGELVLVALYTYDTHNRRNARLVVLPGLTADQRFAYDGWREVEELVPVTGTEGTHAEARKVFVWGREVDELLAYQRKEGGNWVSYYPVQDRRESVVKLLDAQGNVVENVEYDPYGKATVYVGGSPQAFSSVENPYLYQGRRVDPETGFVYMRNRYLHTGWGRFLTNDPIGLWADGVNLGNGYGFVGNQPNSWLDPLGLHASAGWWKRLKALFKIAKLTKRLNKLKTLAKQIEKAIKSELKQIAKHKKKLADYLADPDHYDNKGILKRCKTPAERRRIIAGRKKKLEKDIKKHEDELNRRQKELADVNKSLTDILSQLNVLGVAGMMVAPATTDVAQNGGGFTDYVGAGIRDAIGFFDPGVLDVIEWASGK
jgi:RHS repeat-associated protein